MSTFPQEIYDTVIDRCRRDVPTLLQCALTCRAWALRSRYNLYRTTTIQQQKQLYGFSQALAAAPQIADLVQELVLAPPRDDKPTIVRSAAAALAYKLPNVSKISIVQPPFMITYPGVCEHVEISLRTACCLTLFPRLTYLSLIDVTLSSFLDFVRLITALPCLTTLECRSMIWERRGVVAPNSPMNDPGWLGLERLSIIGPWNDMMGLQSLFKILDPRTLKHLAVDSCAADDIRELLPSYTMLETITFAVLQGHQRNLDGLCSTINMVLAATSSRRLRRVCLDFTQTFNSTRYDLIEAVETAGPDLIAGLSQPGDVFANVRVEVHVADHAESTSWWRAEFETALSELREQGVLDVLVWEPWGHDHTTEEMHYVDGSV
ncbi:hypothetical protein ONZ51_g6723 [Trametes cubensis]|uniref:F-box domain-containing protein n=1 Tax=Trametes cubensis TaxID=1111947 RepID=A0AAD7X9T3_9APHY|nr:hypothetical protein ONZ51_g6723 [Trametes cubensis]